MNPLRLHKIHESILLDSIRVIWIGNQCIKANRQVTILNRKRRQFDTFKKSVGESLLQKEFFFYQSNILKL